MSNLITITEKIKADGHFSVPEIRNFVSAILADSEVSETEYEAFADLVNHVSGNPDNAKALRLVAMLITALHFLEDEDSTAILTDDELARLTTLIGADGKVDEIEAAMLNFVKALSVTKGELDRNILNAETIGEAIAIIASDNFITDAEAKALYLRVRQDGDVDNEELAALVELYNTTPGSDLWKETFKVLGLSSVLVDGDEVTYDISEEEGAILMKLKIDKHTTELFEVLVELADTVAPSFADYWDGARQAA